MTLILHRHVFFCFMQFYASILLIYHYLVQLVAFLPEKLTFKE